MSDTTSAPNAWNAWKEGSASRNVMVALLAWLTIMALGSMAVSTPFATETSAGATPNYATVMYLHGLLIGLVGLLSLMAMDIFRSPHRHLRQMVLWGTVSATVLAGIGGIFDRSITDTLPLWIQIVSFFLLDEILIAVTISLAILALRHRTLAGWTAALAAAAALGAALMGHLAGWILEFGNQPAFLGSYANWAGFSLDDWRNALIGSHSHQMVSAVLAVLAVVLMMAFRGDPEAGVVRRWPVRLGLSLVMLGTIGMTVMYVLAAFTQIQPPTLFTSGPGGANGIASDDLVTGLGVMLGGFIALAGVALARAGDRLLHWTVAALSAFILVTVVAVGYGIELNHVYYGADTGPGATADAVFTWWHQDFAFFVIPAMMLVLLVVHRLVTDERRRDLLALGFLLGGGIAFVGGLVNVLLVPATLGLAFGITTVGGAILLLTMAATLWTLARPEQAPAAAVAGAPRGRLGGSTGQAGALRHG